MSEKENIMTLTQFINNLIDSSAPSGAIKTIYGFNGNTVNVYPLSVQLQENALFFIGREQRGKYLYVVTNEGISNVGSELEGELVDYNVFGNGLRAKRCFMNHYNAGLLREMFSFTQPVQIGLMDSFGFGDRLGIANPAHIRALAGSHMRPILAQQSIRELERTQRTAEDVLDAASWAVFQEGYNKGFGADADHLKTTEDIDRYARAGFTMYTFDPSVYVVNEAAKLSLVDVLQRLQEIDTGNLNLDDVHSRYVGCSIKLVDGVVIEIDKDLVTRAFLKYAGVVAHTVRMYKHLKHTYSSLPTEVEMSVDETDTPTTPFEHYFIANELNKQGVQFVSLAPRFIGDFEKGVDYRGDLTLFEREYKQHISISKMLGPYKISIHSGSDKFGVYKMIGSLRSGNVHVKTAGTSYLEALRTVAKAEPELLRDILSFACGQYDEDRKSYHVTGRLDKVPDPQKCTHQELFDLFDQHDTRQILHVTFGKVLTTKDEKGNFLFRDKLMECLNQHEDVHYQNIIKHFRKHLDPFLLDQKTTS
jgi:hypothetical protein